MLNYAALDAYAAHLIYEKLAQIHPPQPLPIGKLPCSSNIILYHDDLSWVIARGSISPEQKECDGIAINSRRAVITVTDVLVPGAIIATHHKRALSTFGAAPFTLVCLRSHLQLFQSPNPMPHMMPSNSSNQLSQPEQSRSPAIVSEEFQAGKSANLKPSEPVEEIEGPSLAELISDQVQDIDDVDAPDSTALSLSTENLPHEVDVSSAAEGNSVLGPIPDQWNTRILSRVLNDPFHLFNRIYISAVHSLRKEFARALRDALFVPDIKDKSRIAAWGATQKPPLSFDDLVCARPAWVWKHCKRVILPPQALYPLVESVFRTYGPLKDAKTSMPLFNPTAWRVAKNILNLIRDGYVSDPPGIPLYAQIGIDNTNGGLPIYRCSRGTTFTEGGVHTHLRSRLPTSGASIRHVNACLLDFVIRHNKLVRELSTLYLIILTNLPILGWNIQQHQKTL
ncbi:hypothetical protein BYT27DRAFT_7095289 [Phlegmacium glaucopus]|nr:hypothetical protein BYT27DRAFT_7095289 [Phlegmacium glaucopus]